MGRKCKKETVQRKWEANVRNCTKKMGRKHKKETKQDRSRELMNKRNKGAKK